MFVTDPNDVTLDVRVVLILLVVLRFNATLTAKVISCHRLLFSHASAKVRGVFYPFG